jgi:hypothetical protein
MTIRRWTLPLIACAAVFLLAWPVYWLAASGMRVSLTNRGPNTLRNATVHVTGRSYLLGDLAAGETRTVKVSPTSESHVEIGFMNPDGSSVRLIAGCYIEPGYRGEIQIDLRDSKLERVRDQSSVY